MTDETKKLFNAPWSSEEYEHGHGAWVVRRPEGYLIAENMAGQDANRLARLPELYDALVDMVSDHCFGCLLQAEKIDTPTVSLSTFIEKGCPLRSKTCDYDYWALIKKVRDGE